MTLGEKLQKLRRERGMSQDQLAELLGVSRQAVSKWERDEAVPDTEKVIRLSEIFSVSIDYLLKDRPEPARKTNETAVPDFFSQVAEWFKLKGYYLGYAVIFWGAWNFLSILVFGGTVMGFVGWSGGIFSVPLLWGLLLGAAKVAGGILIVHYGKRYALRYEAEKEEQT